MILAKTNLVVRKVLKIPHCVVPTALKKKEKNRREQKKKERRALEKIL